MPINGVLVCWTSRDDSSTLSNSHLPTPPERPTAFGLRSVTSLSHFLTIKHNSDKLLRFSFSSHCTFQNFWTKILVVSPWVRWGFVGFFSSVRTCRRTPVRRKYRDVKGERCLKEWQKSCSTWLEISSHIFGSTKALSWTVERVKPS